MLVKELSLEEKLAEGGHREVYRVGDEAFKVVKPYKQKRYFGIRLQVPSWVYSLYKSGRMDYNVAEMENYLNIVDRIPSGLHDCFVALLRIQNHEGKKIIVSELVRDFDGTLSKTLSFYGQVNDPIFWQMIGELEKFFLDKDIPYFDIRRDNILVRKRANGELVPVLIDYERATIRAYPFQLNLLVRSERARKIKRRFSRLREKYQPKIPSKT